MSRLELTIVYSTLSIFAISEIKISFISSKLSESSIAYNLLRIYLENLKIILIISIVFFCPFNN